MDFYENSQSPMLQPAFEKGFQELCDRWRALPKDTFTEGRTTRRDVLTRLDPPSRIMALRGRTVFYYLLEDSHLVGLNLVIYNQSDTVVRYDRAVFFFDSDDRLESWALSDEVIRDDD